MPTSSKYGNMPVNANLLAKVKGDAGVYRVLGIDWWNHWVLLDRSVSNLRKMVRTELAP
jgi:hypothetical protein